MSGPRPKPVELRILEGNPGKRPIPPEHERPTVKRQKPVAPPNLPAEAAILWRELVKLLDGMGVLTTSDRRALEMLCRAYADYLKARQIVDEVGLVYETLDRNNLAVWKKNPAVDVANQAHTNVVRLLVEFGLTPSARTKVSKEGPKKDPLGSFLDRRNGSA